MKKNTLALATALALGSVLSVAHANEAAQSSVEQVNPKAVTYPTTQKVDVVDDYFGTKVSDPYRWLEDDLSPETAEWVKAQNAVTFDYLSKIPYRKQIEERITSSWITKNKANRSKRVNSLTSTKMTGYKTKTCFIGS